ncbi:MAG: hypothetical protein ABH823_04490 [bacterium]
MSTAMCANLRGPGVEMLVRWRTGVKPEAAIAMMASSEMRLDGQDAEGRNVRNMTGGLGILQFDTARADADPQMRNPKMRSVFTALAHTEGRGDQKLVAGGQEITAGPWSLADNPNFAELGVVGEVALTPGSEDVEPIRSYLYKPFLEGHLDTPVVVHAVDRPGISDVFYPPAFSLEALYSQIVLGKAAFLLGRELDLWNGETPRGRAVVHDCHAAFLPYYIFRHNLERFNNDWEAALEATRAISTTTVHAPQPGTVYNYGYDVLSQVFKSEHIIGLFRLGHHHQDQALISTLNLAMELSQAITFVSEGHKEYSMEQANGLIPAHMFGRKNFYTTANIVNPLVWMDEEQIALLDQHCDGWRGNPKMFTPELQSRLLFNEGFRKGLMQIVESRRLQLRALLKEQGIEISEETLVAAGMRRAAEYKLNKAHRIIEARRGLLAQIAKRFGPAHLLFGGIVPANDHRSAVAFGNMLSLLSGIDADVPGLGANWFENYNEYSSPVILRGVDVWMMFSDPLDPDVGVKEAFGPSGAKKLQLGGLTLGLSDGWAPHINRWGTGTTIAGPKTHVHGVDVGRALRERMLDPHAQAVMFESLADDFMFHLGNQLALLRQERDLVRQGRGELSPALPLRLAAMFTGLQDCHPRNLLDTYAGIVG